MQITRQHFLATARLPGNQHRAVTARHPRRQLQQLPTAGLDRNRAVIFLQLAACMTCHLLQQLTRLEGFDQIILRALAHRRYRTLDTGIGGHQQNRQPRLLLANLLQQLMAIHARHVHITQYQTERLARQLSQRLLSTGAGADCVAA